ncbi:MAG: hypothetical protein ACI8TX_000823 [Hyphomicrobiaceae bacterium]|jgi:hypothetical protein
MSDLPQRIHAFIASHDTASVTASPARQASGQTLDQLAHEVLLHQAELFPRWKTIQGGTAKPSTPGTLISPSTVRPFPAELYKADVAAVQVTPAHVFETSGTGSGQSGRVNYSKDDLDLMRVAIRVNAADRLFPDGPGKTRVLVLAPPPEVRPGNIMAWGMQSLIETFSTDGVMFLFGADGPDLSGLLQHIERATDEDTALTLIGASFGFVHLMEGLATRGQSFTLPAGSRLMDAGGYKGRSRELTRKQFAEFVGQTFGISADCQTNLLGMTELGSQFYDHRILDAVNGPARKQNPPWTRTWAVDPETLHPNPLGERGLLVHLDIANFDHPALILTQDIGRCFDDGFEIEGRAKGADARGCSLAIEEFMDREKTK